MADPPSPTASPPAPAAPSPPPARSALVTGAGRGIGRALSLGLGRAGLSIGLLGRSRPALEELAATLAAQGVVSAVVLADVLDWEQVARAARDVEEALGGIDLLVNNAAVIEDEEVAVWEADPARWWNVVEVDLRGVFHCVRAVVPGMLARGGGRVIDLNSRAGAQDREIYSAYCAAKAGLFRISGNLHLAGFDRGLRAFEVSPGHIRTDMTASMPMHAGRTEWTAPKDLLALVLAIARGELDAWSGGFLVAGVDTSQALIAARSGAARTIPLDARRLTVRPYGPDDPLAPTPP